ncbi:MAG: RNA polymerase subunit sigma-70 [Planctomycetia bacterium]|nr:RNA polymerase subunit sigma-70 [Planctomycetia bacterium]
MDERFVHDLIAVQARLYAYILSLVLDRNVADEVLQNTNVVLCRKAAEYASLGNFPAWACGVARFEVLAHRKLKGRTPLMFDAELLDCLAEEATQATAGVTNQQRALADCLDELSGKQRDLILDRYRPGGSVKELASKMSRPVGSISQTLYRIRNLLLECIERRLKEAPPT